MPERGSGENGVDRVLGPVGSQRVSDEIEPRVELSLVSDEMRRCILGDPEVSERHARRPETA